MVPLANAARSGLVFWPVTITVAGVADVTSAAMDWAMSAGGVQDAPIAHPTVSATSDFAWTITSAGRSANERPAAYVTI
jgi:hypothetical protein